MKNRFKRPGQGEVNIGGDVSGSNIVSGDGNIVGGDDGRINELLDAAGIPQRNRQNTRELSVLERVEFALNLLEDFRAAHKPASDAGKDRPPAAAPQPDDRGGL